MVCFFLFPRHSLFHTCINCTIFLFQVQNVVLLSVGGNKYNQHNWLPDCAGNMYGLLTKCEVKMAGYWPSSFFACVWTETKSRSINSQKRTRPISSHLDRTNLVNKGFIIWLSVKFCSRDTAGSPERARWLHLARSGSQSQRAIWFILPAHRVSHIIRHFIIWLQ